MTLEFQNPPFLSNIGLNSSFNNEPDFTSLDRVTSKKTPVISVARKESLLAKGKTKGNSEMSGRYSDDYDSYDDDFNSPSPSKEPSRRYSRSSRRSQVSDRDRSPSSSPPKDRSRSKRASTRRDSFASYRSAYGTNRGKFSLPCAAAEIGDVVLVDILKSMKNALLTFDTSYHFRKETSDSAVRRLIF